jgi:HEPN domain-containing protein
MKPPEEAKRELVEQWLAKADEDFGLAEHLLSEQSPYLGAVGFHSQQAAEKYLKAFLIHHQIDFPKTHDLVEILDLVARVAPALAQSLQDIRALNPYGVEIRYPGDIPQLNVADARQAVELAGKLREAIRAALKNRA